MERIGFGTDEVHKADRSNGKTGATEPVLGFVSTLESKGGKPKEKRRIPKIVVSGFRQAEKTPEPEGELATPENIILPDTSSAVPELSKVIEPIIASKKNRKRLDQEDTLSRLRDKVEDIDRKREEDRERREKKGHSGLNSEIQRLTSEIMAVRHARDKNEITEGEKEKTEKELLEKISRQKNKIKGMDVDLQAAAYKAAGELFTAKTNKKLSRAERQEVVRAALEMVPKPKKGDSTARKKQLETIWEKLMTGEKMTDKDFATKPEKPKKARIDLSPESLVHKAVLSGARKVISGMDKRMEEIDETKRSDKTKERIKELELALRAPLIKVLGKIEKKTGAKTEKKLEREETEDQERQEKTILEAKIKEKLGDAFYTQFLLVKDLKLSELTEEIKEKKPSTWDKIKNIFNKKKEEMGGVSMERKLTMQKIYNIYNGLNNTVEKYTASHMTVERFLIKYL